MKLFVYTLLLVAPHRINCGLVNDEDDSGERKYGLGLDVGGSYKGGLELGVDAKDGSRSVFLNKVAGAKANAGVGVYKSVKPAKPGPLMYNPYPIIYDLRNGGAPVSVYPGYPMPVPNSFTQYPTPLYPVPQRNSFSQYPFPQYNINPSLQPNLFQNPYNPYYLPNATPQSYNPNNVMPINNVNPEQTQERY